MTLFWIFIMCALGSCAGTIAAHLVIQHERDKGISITVEKVLKGMNDPDFFAKTFGEGGEEWDKLWERTTKVRKMIPKDKSREFTDEIIVMNGLEEKNKVLDKWEAKYNNKEEEK